MPIPSTRRRALALVAAVVLILGSIPIVAAADPASRFTARPLSPSGRVTGFKSASADLVKSDPALVKRTDSAAVNVIIKLDYDAVASYAGGVADLPATSPQVTGKALTGKSAAETKYTAHIKGIERKVVDGLKAKVPAAQVGQTLRTAYGGIAARVPAKDVKDILKVAGVVAVQADHLRKPLTDSSPDFIDASPVYPGLGGTSDAGEGVIYGNLDTGVWPEHPSFADLGNLSPPPAKADGTPRTCDYGDNPLTPANDVFACNNKLIGGQPFIDTYNVVIGGEVYSDSARDSAGHGTHTASTSAGNVLAGTTVLGVPRGPIHGIAPGAWVSEYKVCGLEGCFDSDSTAAVGQAILDGVDVINFSISGGTDPFADAVELAFLDAYAAGVFVSTSAGNEGPGASTANHLSPWVISVAASTQTREFSSTLTLTGASGMLVLTGASITAGATAPVVLSSAPPYSNALCTAQAPPGTFTGKIVACQRGGNARVEKGYNVLQGGAVGMILYNPVLADVETDNHWLPTAHLADGTAFLAFVAANPGGVDASFTAGVSQAGQGDVIAAFSSRGPAGLFIKPDVTAPGVQILAGMTPTPDEILAGPPGQFFQAIAGTSMSSPHVAGSAILLAALHPDWSPGQIKSALMTTANTEVVKEDLTTPADPFDFGGGRIDVDDATAAKVTFAESASNFAALGGDPLQAIHLNLPSINAPVMPGQVTTTRWAQNVTGSKLDYKLSTVAPAGSKIEVKPKDLHLEPGETKSFEVTITSDAPTAQYFGQVVLTEKVKKGQPSQRLHLQVAFIPQQGDVTLAQACEPDTVAKNATTSCEITATNVGEGTQTVDIESKTNKNLEVVSAVGATKEGKDRAHVEDVVLEPAEAGIPSVDPGVSPGGYLPLDLFGSVPFPIGDEEILNFTTEPFVYNGVTHDTIGVDSNGYVIVGGGTAEDNNCCSLTGGPSPFRPNNVLAPFWTDLDGTAAPGIFAAFLEDTGTGDTWLVLEWRVNDFGTTHERRFQTWIGINGVQDISFTYSATQTAPAGQDYQVGAENENGEGDISVFLPGPDLVVTSTPGAPGESYTYTLTLKGKGPGDGTLTSSMTADGVLGTTIVKTDVTVTP